MLFVSMGRLDSRDDIVRSSSVFLVSCMRVKWFWSFLETDKIRTFFCQKLTDPLKVPGSFPGKELLHFSLYFYQKYTFCPSKNRTIDKKTLSLRFSIEGPPVDDPDTLDVDIAC